MTANTTEGARTDFAPKQAPEGWDYEKQGKPDILFWRYAGEEAAQAAKPTDVESLWKSNYEVAEEWRDTEIRKAEEENANKTVAEEKQPANEHMVDKKPESDIIGIRTIGKSSNTQLYDFDKANFAQKTYSSKFSPEGQRVYSELAGKPIIEVNDLADAIKNSVIAVRDVPIDFIVRDGHILILNTRSSQALIKAGIPRSKWNFRNRTGNLLYETMLTDQLKNNKLTSAGVAEVRMSGRPQR